jgi:ABC-type amino acid transport substrate-binding protein
MRVERIAIPRGLPGRLASQAAAVFALGFLAAMTASAATLDRIHESGHLRLGFLTDASPFSYRGKSGAAEGYSVALCQEVAEQVRTQLQRPDLVVDWVEVAPDDALREVQAGGIDLLCVPTSATLRRRQDVSFSIPVFAGGIRAAVRKDAPAALRQALGEDQPQRPVWRGSPAAKLIEKTTFAVVSGMTAESWLARTLDSFQIHATIVKVPDHRAGLQQLLDRKVDVLFGDRSVMLEAMDEASMREVVIFPRLFTHEPLSLALARGDDDFALVVDRALSRLYSSGDFPKLYSKWFGDFDEAARTFFLWSTPPPE